MKAHRVCGKIDNQVSKKLSCWLMIIHAFGFLIPWQNSSAQPFLHGETWFGINQYIEYQVGNLPLILAAPHGGTLSPAEIPDRSCQDCVFTTDLFTEDLARRMANSIEAATGCRPHLIINRLHRRKLDANRGMIEGADGHPLGEQAWEDFHGFIQAAKDLVAERFGKGLFIDLHGHGHTIQRLELGYLLFGSELAMSDSVLNTPLFTSYSSIRKLVHENLQNLSHAELLRGAISLGTMYYDATYPAVPSIAMPFPGTGNPYFSGGYNTERHGSMNSGSIDAIQMECNYSGIRDTPDNRQVFSETTAVVLLDFLRQHYFGADFPAAFCVPLTAAKKTFPDYLSIYPNPADDLLFIDTPDEVESANIILYDILGRILVMPATYSGKTIALNLSRLSPGWYVLRVQFGMRVYRNTFFKRA
jgi:N-formylglutamate amidohydrolase